MSQSAMVLGHHQPTHLLTHLSACALNWTHSVTFEDDYKSPWTACERAFDLEFEVSAWQTLSASFPCTDLSVGSELISDRQRFSDLVSCVAKTGRHRNCVVRFCDVCELHQGPAHPHGRDCTGWTTVRCNCSHQGSTFDTMLQLPDLLDPSSTDQVSFMQSRVVDRIPALPTVLFSRSEPWIPASVRPWPRTQQHVDVARHLMIPSDNIVACHPVTVPPPGLLPGHVPLIVERVGELREDFDEVLILIDVIMYPPSNVGRTDSQQPTVRKVRRSRRRLHRRDVLHLGRVGFYCSHIGHRCLVQVNGHLWSADDPLQRTLCSGDFLEVHVPPNDPSDTGGHMF